MLVEPIFKYLPILLGSFLVMIMERKIVCFGTLDQLWFLDLQITTSFSL
jgi:hypothetical protein